MTAALGEVLGLTVFSTSTNVVLVELPAGWSGPGLRDHLVTQRGVYIRECGNKLGSSSSQLVRLVVRPADDVVRLVEGLHAYAATVTPQQ